MYLLTISSFLRTVLIIIVVIYGMKFLMRYILPHMMKNYVDNRLKEMQNKKGVSEEEAQFIQKEKGKVKISRNSSKDGEYVDYEEVK